MSRHKVETTPKVATPEVRVVPYVRVVPSGFVRDAKGEVSRLKATLLVTPDVSSTGGVGERATLNLVTWPASVHRWLKEDAAAWLKLVFAEPYAETLPTPCSPTNQQEIEVHFPKVASLTDLQVDGLNRLWQSTIFGKEATQDQWNLLAKTIADSLGEGATRPGSIQNGAPVGAPDDKAFGEDGQLKSGRPEHPGESTSHKTIESVIQVPHADLALALEFQRAAELCLSLKQACGDPVDRRETQKKQVIDNRFQIQATTELLAQAAVDETDLQFATKLVARQTLRRTDETEEAYIARLNDESQVLWNSTVDKRPPAKRLALVLAAAEKAGAAEHVARQKRENYKQLHASCHMTAQRKRAADTYGRAKLAVGPTSTACKTSPEELEWVGLKTSAAADETSREAKLNEALEAHALTTWPQYEKEKIDIPEGPDRKAVSAFFTLQSTPSLARAFLLALDIEIDIKSLESELSYGFVSAQFRPRDEASLPVPPTHPIPWTLTKFRTRSGDWRFWPATTAELAQQKKGESGAICANSVSQFDGVLMMSRGHSCEPGSNNSRYDVTSMDVRTVAELEMQRRLLRAAELDHDSADDARQAPKRQPFADLEYGGNRLTTGLTLLCKSAQHDAVTRMAMREAKAKPAASGGCVLDDGNALHVVLDAEDLTIGFRLAVGILDMDWTTEWRPLTARQIQFGTSGDPDGKIVEDVLRKLVGSHTSLERIALDSSFHTTPARLMPTAGGKVEAAVDQAICVWDGGPMGVDCASPDDTTGYVRDSLPFGRTLSVPTAAATRLPRLRYGYPYRFAMMAVYSGGISLDLDELELQKHTDPAAGQRFYPPDSCREASTHSRVEPYVRALRQSKLLAPEVLLPGGHATRQNGPMGYETARLLVVRSTAADRDATTGKSDRRLDARATPALAQRIIIAPGMELSEAARHCDPVAGNRPVFDSVQSSTTPPGGLRQIEQGSGSARFPVVKTIARRGIDGRRHIDRRIVVTGQNQGTVSTEDEVSDGVFRQGGSGRNGYYSDPAADRIAVGLRRPGSKTYAFDPMILEIGSGRRFPDRLPIVVTLNRLSKQRLPGALKKDDVVRIRKTRFDPDNAGSITGAGPFACHEVIVTLATNEAFEIDVWCVPTADRLAGEFALTQTLAQYLSLRGAGAAPGEAIAAGAMAELPSSLADMLGKTLAELDDVRNAQRMDEKSHKSIRYIGPGATPVPDAATIKAVAQTVAECLGKSPLPELVGLQSLMVVHACNRPGTEPQIAAQARDIHLDHVTVRPEDIDCADRPAPIRAFRPPKGWRARTKSQDGTYERHPIPVAAAGSNELFLAGDVHLDLSRIDTIEVVATTVLPTSPLFDSSKRKRSVAMKRAGSWPTIPSQSAGDQIVPGRKNRVYKSVEDVFGFRVFPDGSVSHRTSEVVLLRAENLPLPAPGAEGLTKVALGDLFATLADEQRNGAPVQSAAGLRVLRPHDFKDGKARVMEVRINGLARSLDLMRTADRVAKPGDPWLSGTGLIYLVDELIPGEHLPAKHQSNYSKPLQVVLPATRRPAKCDARAPVPVFQWRSIDTATRKTRRRDSVVRIPLGREWFTSGQGERLGIVLWPPKLSIGDIVGLNDNKVPIRWTDRDHAGRPVPMERIVDLGTFSDADLGPGGSFITRRGADPIEDGPPQKRIFMSTRDFPDLARAPNDPLAATFVEDVDMPLADDGTEAETAEPSTAHDAQPSATDKKQSKSSDKSTPPPLRVALVTYEPRFDVEREEWYVDVKLRDGETASPFVRFGLVRYQPHTHRALRCSRPVAQWVKPLPKRSVSISPTGKGLKVVMVGRASTGRSWPSVVNSDDAAAAHQPSMRLSLFEDYFDDAGRSARRFHALTSKTGDDVVNARLLVSADIAFANQWADGALIKPRKSTAARTGDYALWEAEIPLKADACGYKLHVEEVEHFLPATFAEEPVTESFMREQGRFVQGGPRMAVTFDSLFDVAPVQPPK